MRCSGSGLPEFLGGKRSRGLAPRKCSSHARTCLFVRPAGASFHECRTRLVLSLRAAGLRAPIPLQGLAPGVMNDEAASTGPGEGRGRGRGAGGGKGD